MRSDGASSPTAANKTEKERAGKLMDPLVFLPKSLVRAATKLGVSALPHQTGREPYEIFRTTALDEKREGKVW